jgi:hypothetical protein
MEFQVCSRIPGASYEATEAVGLLGEPNRP